MSILQRNPGPGKAIEPAAQPLGDRGNAGMGHRRLPAETQPWHGQPPATLSDGGIADFHAIAHPLDAEFSGTRHFPGYFHDDVMLKDAVDAIAAAAAVLDGAGRIVIVNQQWREMEDVADWPRLGNDVTDILHLAEDGKRDRRIALWFGKVLVGQWPEFELPFSWEVAGVLRQYRMHVAHLAGDRDSRTLVINEDVADADRLNHQIWFLSQKLIETEERERRRLAREIHDTTAHDLIAIGFDLRRALALTTDPQMQEVLVEIGGLVRRTQSSIRTTSFLLHPPTLGRRGLTDDLEALVRGLAHRMDAEVLLECSVKQRFPAEIELALYRVAQEALTNVHRHACASRVVVRYRKSGRWVVMEVEDDGIGIDRRDETHNSGVGLRGMRARLREIGGRLTIARCSPGTAIKARVKLPPA